MYKVRYWYYFWKFRLCFYIKIDGLWLSPLKSRYLIVISKNFAYYINFKNAFHL